MYFFESSLFKIENIIKINIFLKKKILRIPTWQEIFL